MYIHTTLSEVLVHTTDPVIHCGRQLTFKRTKIAMIPGKFN